jgi:hypothetical protein
MSNRRDNNNQRNQARLAVDHLRTARLVESVRRSLPKHGNSNGQRPQKGPPEQVILKNPGFETIVQIYNPVTGLTQTTGEAANPAQAYGTTFDAFNQIIGIIAKAEGNSPLQRSMNRQAAVKHNLRHFALELDPKATIYVGAEPGSLDLLIWGTDPYRMREVAITNGLLFLENRELTLMFRAMRPVLAKQKAETLKAVHNAMGICPR